MRYELVDGETSWKSVETLEQNVYPPDVQRTLVWRDVRWAYALKRVLVWDEDTLVCNVGIYERHGSYDATPVRIVGVGSVMTRSEWRRGGIAGSALELAHAYMRENLRGDFGVLFCEPHNDAFYSNRGWTAFKGSVTVRQNGISIPFTIMGARVFELKFRPDAGLIDLCGLPW